MVADREITFDEGTYHFYATGLDITNNLRRADKLRLVPDFDIERENYRLSAESGAGAQYGDEPLNESTIKEFGKQIVNDPLSAPLEALDKGVTQIFSSSGVRTLLIVGIAGVVLYFALKSK